VAAPREFEILDLRRLPSTSPQRLGKRDVLVIYALDPYRRYVVTIPEEDFSEDKLREVIKADIEERGRWLNKKFPL